MRKRRSAGRYREGTITCAFCDSMAATDDHVPPKGVFPDELEWRVNLITVPACRYCNMRHELDDQYLQIFLGSMELVGRKPAAKSLIERARCARKRASPALQHRLESELRSDVELRTPAGVYAGKATLWAADLPRLMRIARMIVTGLYFHHFRKRLPVTHVVAASIFPDPLTRTENEQREIAAIFAQFANDEPHQTGGGVFQYRYHALPDDPDRVEWLMTLYDSFAFAGSIVRRDTPLGRLAEREDQRASVGRIKRSKKRLERGMSELTTPTKPPSVDSLTRIEDKVFADEVIALDGKHFINCKFFRCKLVYSGGEVPLITAGRFDSCEFQATEGAERTLHWLGRLYQSGAAGMVEGVFDSIRRGRRGT